MKNTTNNTINFTRGEKRLTRCIKILLKTNFKGEIIAENQVLLVYINGDLTIRLVNVGGWDTISSANDKNKDCTTEICYSTFLNYIKTGGCL